MGLRRRIGVGDRRGWLTAAVAGLLLLAVGPTGPSWAAPEAALSADAFVAGIGVNTHLGYDDTLYGRYEDIIKPRLKELGVRSIREGYFQDRLVPRYFDVASLGIKLVLIFSADKAARQVPMALPVLEAVEGLNEPDHGEGWVEVTRKEQTALYRAVKGSNLTSHLPVLVSGMANTRDSPGKLGPLSDALDLGNTHNYAGGLPPTSGGWGIELGRALAEARTVCGDRPLWSTECGYHNRIEQTGHPGVSEAAAAKYLPRMHALLFGLGLERRYSYELADEKPDPGMTDMEQHFGLLRSDGSRKPAFIALRNLIRILRDPGTGFSPGRLDYTLTGDLRNVRHLLLQKRDGSYWLLLWQEVPSFDVRAKRDLSPAALGVMVTLASPLSAGALYRPGLSDRPLGALLAASRVRVSVPDELVILKLVPAKAGAIDSDARGGRGDHG
jgi:hypothetical protein